MPKNQNDSDPINEPKFGEGEVQKEPESNDDSIKFGKDELAAVLKQNSHAQALIKELKDENAAQREELSAMKEDLSKASTIDDLLDGMAKDPLDGQTPQVNTDDLLTKLEERIFDRLSESEQESARKQNLQQAVTMLEEKFGENYSDYVDQRAKELGLDRERMTEIAQTSPKAFGEFFGETVRTSSPTQGTVTGAPEEHSKFNFGQVGMQRHDKGEDAIEAKRAWNSEDFQRQYRAEILKKAQSKGSAFGNTI